MMTTPKRLRPAAIHRLLHKFLLVLICTGSVLCASPQHLQRKALLGVALYQKPPDSLLKKFPVKGALVQYVIPKSTAAELALQPFDVVVNINGKEVTEAADVPNIIGSLYEGESVRIAYVRKGKMYAAKTTAVGRPKDTSTNAEVLYDEVAVNTGYVRCLVKKPFGTKRWPAVFFIQGFNCSSVDYLPEKDSYRRMINGLVDEGFAVFRMEKSGVGDSRTATTCETIGFNEDLEGFKQGYKKLLQYGFVDTNNVFLFGHSLGGITAPLLAQERMPKGVAVYGTVVKLWQDYLLNNLRIQRPLEGADYAATEDSIAQFRKTYYELFVNKRSPLELSADAVHKRALADGLQWDGNRKLFGRDYTYSVELAGINLSAVWKNVNSAVLSIYGESDINALNDEDHRRIVDIVNRYHPGQAAFLLLPETNHGMYKVGTMEEYLQRVRRPDYKDFEAERFNYQLMEILAGWMHTQMKK